MSAKKTFGRPRLWQNLSGFGFWPYRPSWKLAWMGAGDNENRYKQPSIGNDRRSFKEIQTSQSKCVFEYLCLLMPLLIISFCNMQFVYGLPERTPANKNTNRTVSKTICRNLSKCLIGIFKISSFIPSFSPNFKKQR